MKLHPLLFTASWMAVLAVVAAVAGVLTGDVKWIAVAVFLGFLVVFYGIVGLACTDQDKG